MTVEVNKIYQGDCLETMRSWPGEFIDCVVTSPPYFGLRDYGIDGQVGSEATPEEFTSKMVEIFSEVRRVMKGKGTLWLNLGDSYCGYKGGHYNDKKGALPNNCIKSNGAMVTDGTPQTAGVKNKDLIGIPWMVAFALRDHGWYLRSEIIWDKPNPMPESVMDRPSCCHEKIFLFSKSTKYYYNADAIRNPPSESLLKQVKEGYRGSAVKDFTGNGVQDASEVKSRIVENARKKVDKQRGHGRRHAGFNDRWDQMSTKEQMMFGSNKRNIWRIATQGFKGAHFATFPEKLIEPCVLAGCPEGGIVLDPFFGSGTTGVVAKRMSCNFIGCELNPEYIAIANKRLQSENRLF